MLGKLLKYEFKYLAKEFTRYYAVYGALLVAVILMFQLAMLEKSSSGGSGTTASSSSVSSGVSSSSSISSGISSSVISVSVISSS